MRQHRFSIVMVAVLMVLLPSTVLAQGIYRPCPDQNALKRTDRYLWDRYNVNPIGPRELDRTTLGLVRVVSGTGGERVDPKEQEALERTRVALQVAVAKVVFGVAEPDISNTQAEYNLFWEELVRMVENNEWTDSATDPEFSSAFDCGSTRLDLPMAFGARIVGGRLTIYATRFAPIVGFTPAPEAWIINPIRVNSGPYAGRLVRVVIFKECFNLSGFFAPEPPPPPPPPPPPAPPPPPPPVQLVPPPPPPPPPPFTLLVPKLWLDDDGDEEDEDDRPRGWQNVTFRLMDDSGVVIAAGRLNGQSQILFVNVPPGTSSVRIVEDLSTIPRGWLDRTGSLALSLAVTGTEFRFDQPYVNQERERGPCRFLALPCWAWIPIGAAAVIVPTVIGGEERDVPREKYKGGDGTPSNPGPSPQSTGMSISFSVNLGGIRR